MKISIQILAIALLLLSIQTTGNAVGSGAVRAIGDEERKALFPSRKMIEFGKTAAETNCAGCHGMDGLSDGKGKPNLAGQRTVYLYRVLKAFQSGARKDEARNHNAFLNDQALLSTAIYYANLTPASSRQDVDLEKPAAETEPSGADEDTTVSVDDPFFGIRDSMKKCIRCHGESGQAPGSGMPSLTAQDPEYFMTSMMAYVDGSRKHSLMRRLVGSLDEATIKEMGVFYAVQQPQQTDTRGDGDINVGKRLAEDCESCHGADGNATGPSMPTLAGQDAKYFVKAMKHYKDGTRKHKQMFEAVNALNEQEMTDLASYYAAQVPRRRDVRMPLNSTEWIRRCERCHGIDGNSSDPRFPMLAGQDENYLQTALRSYANGARDSSTMHAMADPLSAMDIERIAAYFASQQPKAVVYMQLPCADDPQ